MEREPREMVRQKTPHPKELKAKAHKLFGSPTKSADNTFDAGLADNGEFINGIQKKEGESVMEEHDEGIPQQDLEDEEDEETYKGETMMMVGMAKLKNGRHKMGNFCRIAGLPKIGSFEHFGQLCPGETIFDITG